MNWIVNEDFKNYLNRYLFIYNLQLSQFICKFWSLAKFHFTQIFCNVHTYKKHTINRVEWSDFYWRWIIRLGRAWVKNGSSSDNPSGVIHDGSSQKTDYRDGSCGWMIRLPARFYTQTQGATKVLSDSPGPVEWLVGLVSLDYLQSTDKPGAWRGQAIFLMTNYRNERGANSSWGKVKQYNIIS